MDNPTKNNNNNRTKTDNLQLDMTIIFIVDETRLPDPFHVSIFSITELLNSVIVQISDTTLYFLQFFYKGR